MAIWNDENVNSECQKWNRWKCNVEWIHFWHWANGVLFAKCHLCLHQDWVEKRWMNQNQPQRHCGRSTLKLANGCIDMDILYWNRVNNQFFIPWLDFHYTLRHLPCFKYTTINWKSMLCRSVRSRCSIIIVRTEDGWLCLPCRVFGYTPHAAVRLYDEWMILIDWWWEVELMNWLSWPIVFRFTLLSIDQLKN